MPHGGRRKGAGRKKGSLNKLTEDMKRRAMALGLEALERVGNVSKDPDSDSALIRAASLLLNHGFGRPASAGSVQQDTIKVERIYRWAQNESEATLDPARARMKTAEPETSGAKSGHAKA